MSVRILGTVTRFVPPMALAEAVAEFEKEGFTELAIVRRDVYDTMCSEGKIARAFMAALDAAYETPVILSDLVDSPALPPNDGGAANG